MPRRLVLELCVMVQLSEMTNGSDSSPLSPPRHHSVVTTLPAHWWHTWQMANATVTLLWHTSFMGGALGCSTHTVAHFRSVWRACSVTNASKMSIANVFFHPADTFLQNVADGLCCFDSIDCIYLSICIFFWQTLRCTALPPCYSDPSFPDPSPPAWICSADDTLMADFDNTA